MEFHWALLEPGATAWIRRVLDQVWLASQRYVRLFVSTTVDDAMRDHRQLLAAASRATAAAPRSSCAGISTAPSSPSARLHRPSTGPRPASPCARPSSPTTSPRPRPASATSRRRPRQGGPRAARRRAQPGRPCDRLGPLSGRQPAAPLRAGNRRRRHRPAVERFAPGTRVWASGRGLGVAPTARSRSGSSPPRRRWSRCRRRRRPRGRRARRGRPGRLAAVLVARARPRRRERARARCDGRVGSVAVQTARILGAGRVVAVGSDAARLERAGALGADAIVELERRLPRTARDRVRRHAADGRLRHALGAAARGGGGGRRPRRADRPPRAVGGADRDARLGPRAREADPDPRLLELRRPARRARARLPDVLAHAAGGRIEIDDAAVPLARIAEGWARQARAAAPSSSLVP